MNLCSRPVSADLERRITSKGGLAPNGQPLFRVIWGADRLTVVGGEWNKYDNQGNLTGTITEEKLCVKYPQAENRWIMEMWTPPENYGSLIEWELRTVVNINGKKINQLGPYPANGEYELLKVIETPRGKFVPLTATVCEAMIAVAVLNRQLPTEIRMKAHREAQEAMERSKEYHRVELIEQHSRPNWAKNPHVVIP